MSNVRKVYMYPRWLRFWHWINAILFFLLILSGVSMQYSDTSSLLMPFEYAIVTHNVCGILLSVVFLYYLYFNIKTRNYKQYIPQLRGAKEMYLKQMRYYLYGVFKGEPHPFETTPENKFNPLQRLTYFLIMFLAVPGIIITGWLLMFPELAPEQIMGMGGVWPMALLHITIGFFLNLFFIGHIYLATHGETATANFKSMINGWHLHIEHSAEESTGSEISEDVAINSSEQSTTDKSNQELNDVEDKKSLNQ
ncbi:MAG TPA: cytochrome b/b6 domain-containing protein [Candidatus Kapabacteria bacterium]|jgi:thiosulfate reductase cytochrome b subunit|nr:cytochrome b/b6 domain-containing protein [Candidatus Kapabacteria bacterium]